MTSERAAEFGDRVLVLSAPATNAAGIAGQRGVVYGITTPSVTGVTVVGSAALDKALNVFFEESGQNFWLAPQLVEFIDHDPGATMNLKGVPKQWTRDSAGAWIESSRTLPVSEWPARISSVLRSLWRR